MNSLKTMKTTGITLLFATLLIANPATAQGKLEKLRTEKLNKPFAQAVAWELDYKTALERAAVEGKVVFGYFTRSFSP